MDAGGTTTSTTTTEILRYDGDRDTEGLTPADRPRTTVSTTLSPTSPSSASAVTPQTAAAAALSADNIADGDDPKKPRACEACRGLKVRCDPDPVNPDGPCKRCAKAGRACVVTQPTRKRQKKTDSRVAELEKKIDALTATLHASRDPVRPREEEFQQRPLLAPPPMSLAQQQQQQQQQIVSPQSRGDAWRAATGIVESGRGPPPMVMAGQKRKFADRGEDREESSQPASTPVVGGATQGRDYSDIVDRGIITMERAVELFARYTDRMAPHLPGVVFPEGTTAAEIRKTKPILFLAIMAAASSEMPTVQRGIVKELMQMLAEKVVVVGEKSLELVQALQVSVIWYWPPEHFEELKFYQLVHMAAVMAIDIGLGRKKPGRNKRHIPYTWRDHPFKKHPLPDPCSLESRRAWLACYFLTTNTAMALHRPNLVRWNAFMSECMDVLESSPDAAPTDRYMCHLVWTHRMAEEVGVQFAMDDPSAGVNITDPRTQYALRGFERDLEKYQKSLPKEMRQRESTQILHQRLILWD
jgi:hypothetical protein